MMSKTVLELCYICNHILRTAHAQIRQYQTDRGGVILSWCIIMEMI